MRPRRRHGWCYTTYLLLIRSTTQKKTAAKIGFLRRLIIGSPTIQGTLSSVLTDPGDGTPGTQHWKLVHYFVDADGDAFWTQDEAVCEPVDGNPSACELEDEMTVMGGSGKFANATGNLHNSGSASITDPTFQTTPFGSVTGEITGRLCADGL